MDDAIERKLRASIESFAADVTDLLTRAVADSVASALGGGKSVLGKGRPSHGRGSSLDMDTVIVEVRRQGGRRVEQIARSLRTSTKSLRLPLRKLIHARRVKTTGQRRGMRYTAVR